MAGRLLVSSGFLWSLGFTSNSPLLLFSKTPVLILRDVMTSHPESEPVMLTNESRLSSILAATQKHIASFPFEVVAAARPHPLEAAVFAVVMQTAPPRHLTLGMLP
ncbi:hypothetical protein L211DRAFT_3845 [Terfezia boudieri ATCC MYA-4762]|uniref:Uncharacterized protein n=1 Tax=Terfezia boudieri ATCC MYA-4762 TaxID=1051890 RepID=A0A3N4M2S4_9PEZI|nr:hypothetical protein L211DRAFT_3845 [Terfezia boudieri ATCC MYA-4762]